MKTQRFIIVLATFAVLFTACKKDDHRDKWVGSYECEEVYSYTSGPGGHPDSQSGTEVYQINIVVTTKGDWFDFFENRNEKLYEVGVNKDGSFFESNDTDPSKPRIISGKFHSDSLTMTIVHSYSPGSSCVSDYKGKKIIKL